MNSLGIIATPVNAPETLKKNIYMENPAMHSGLIYYIKSSGDGHQTETVRVDEQFLKDYEAKGS